MNMDMDIDGFPSPKFSCGSDLATLAVASDLAHHSWLKVSQLQATLLGSDRTVSVKFEQSDLGKFNVLAFATSLTADFLHENGDSICSENTVDFEFLSCKENPDISIRAAAAAAFLVSSGNNDDFKFLCSKRNPSFSINAAAISLFLSVRDQLSDLKNQIVSDPKPKPFIITGHGLGGSVAALFTLWLLDSLNTVTTKRPLCITFGSPLIGDQAFQEALSQYSTWNSCFLHLVHKDDPFPTLFSQELHKLSSKKNVQLYCPFGTYLFCSDSGSTCFESSGSVSQLLEKLSRENYLNGVLSGFDYGSVVDCLRGKVFCRDNAKPNWRHTDDSFTIGVKAQLAAIGFQQPQKIGNKIAEAESDAIIDKMEAIDSTKKLNEVKMRMAQLGWYKKETARDDIGYYDSYKNMRATRDNDVVLFKKTLDIYWEKTLEEAENKPQKVAAHLRKRWLYSGTLYRRMVEPLHIADFYKVEGKRDYIKLGRPKYLNKLEEYNNKSEKTKPEDRPGKRHAMISAQLTDDSCFWAHVEEAILSCESLKKGGNTDQDRKALQEFEKYAYNLIKNYEVSAEIFLKDSTFMKWWKLYDLILKDNLMGEEHNSKLILFMKEPKNRKGKDGMYTCEDDDDDDDDMEVSYI